MSSRTYGTGRGPGITSITLRCFRKIESHRRHCQKRSPIRYRDRLKHTEQRDGRTSKGIVVRKDPHPLQHLGINACRTSHPGRSPPTSRCSTAPLHVVFVAGGNTENRPWSLMWLAALAGTGVASIPSVVGSPGKESGPPCLTLA